jgi:cysteine desulfuration protein SufE
VSKLQDLVQELGEAERRERIELLIELAGTLPPLPEQFERQKDEAHRIPECQSPVYMFVECNDGIVEVHADVPVEAPTVRGFVAMLVEGLHQVSSSEALAFPNDILERSGVTEILGMQRVSGLHAVVFRLKHMITHVCSTAAASPSS